VRSTEAQPLSFAVRQALIQACGTVFHWKSGLVQLFVASGVPEPAVIRYVDQGLAKFKIARAVLTDLDARGAAGHRVQWQIVQSMLELDGPADNDASEAEARSALTALRKAAGSRTSAAHSNGDAEVLARRRRAEMQAAVLKRQGEQIASLRTRFAEIGEERNAQRRGYEFERFLVEFFRAFDIEYRASYRTGVEQIDGAFHHGGRDYLVEAKWQRLPPDANDLFDFAMKVSGKLDGTLGLIVSMVPPSAEILEHVSRQTRCVLVMDGRDLALILEGQMTLPEALDLKSRRAAQEGVLFHSLAERIA
jgi:hypothetical protein